MNIKTKRELERKVKKLYLEEGKTAREIAKLMIGEFFTYQEAMNFVDRIISWEWEWALPTF